MLTKFKKLFSKEDGVNSEIELNKITPAEEKIVTAEVRNPEPKNVEEKILETESLKTATDSSSEINEKDSSSAKQETKKDHPVEEIKEEVIKVLKTCYDPEIPVDVWELGLIYDIRVATNGDVLIVMTLTSPSCPVAGILPGEIEQKVKEHPVVNDCKVELTFDPPWSQRNMSEVAKLELGFL